MKTTKILDNTPVAMLTVGQLKEVLQPQQLTQIQVETKEVKRYVYGLRGIRELFNVSHATAQKYKDTFLKSAIIQNGRKVVIDAEEAIKLFEQAGKGNSYGK